MKSIITRYVAALASCALLAATAGCVASPETEDNADSADVAGQDTGKTAEPNATDEGVGQSQDAIWTTGFGYGNPYMGWGWGYPGYGYGVGYSTGYGYGLGYGYGTSCAYGVGLPGCGW